MGKFLIFSLIYFGFCGSEPTRIVLENKIHKEHERIIFNDENRKPQNVRDNQYENVENKRIAFEDDKLPKGPRHDHEMMDRFHHRGMMDEMKPIVNCTQPNTRANYDNTCICMEGFFGDQPVTDRGCWSCSAKCHHYASCNYPGNCSCQYGLLGDGTTECAIPTPTSISLKLPNKGDILPHLLTVYYTLSTSFLPFNGYIKFSDSKTRAFILSNNSIAAFIPENIKTKTQVQISIDGSKWSDSLDFEPVEGKKIETMPSKQPKKTIFVRKARNFTKRSIIFLILSSIYVGFYFLTKQKRTKKEKSDEIALVTNPQSQDHPAELRRRKVEL